MTSAKDPKPAEGGKTSTKTKRWTREDIVQRTVELSSEGREKADPKHRKRKRIIRAATDLFTKQGYRKTSMDEIALHAGVAKGTLYLYAKNKAELLLEAIANEKLQQKEALIAITDETRPPHERLKIMITNGIVILRQMPLVAKLMRGDRDFLFALEGIDESLRQEFLARRTEFPEMLIELAAPNRFTPAQRQARAHVLISLSYFSLQLEDERLLGGLSLEEFAEVFADMIVHGIVGPTI